MSSSIEGGILANGTLIRTTVEDCRKTRHPICDGKGTVLRLISGIASRERLSGRLKLERSLKSIKLLLRPKMESNFC